MGITKSTTKVIHCKPGPEEVHFQETQFDPELSAKQYKTVDGGEELVVPEVRLIIYDEIINVLNRVAKV